MVLTGPDLNHCEVVYRDKDIFAINKPAGIPVHGSRILEGTPETLLTQVRRHQGQLSYPVHRLDRPVSGVVLFTGDKSLLRKLGHQFENGEVKKRYLAVARGWIESGNTLSYPLLPPRDERKPGSVAREAITRYEPIARIELAVPVDPYPSSRYSLLALYPETGRRHQLRMHLKHISHHLIGDTTYGRGEHNRVFREKFACRRLLLHAWSLEFNHPDGDRTLRVHAPLDLDFNRIIEEFGWGAALESWADSHSGDNGEENQLRNIRDYVTT